MPFQPRWIPVSLTLILLTYGNMIVSNFITYRQVQYAQYLYDRNQSLQPLRDVVFVNPNLSIPYIARSQYMNVVDVLTVAWMFIGLSLWYKCGKNVIYINEVLSAEIILLPLFAIAQILTVVPDSYPQCLVDNGIPGGTDTDWIWTRFGRGCGNMLWCSAIAQFVIFLRLYDRLLGKHGCIRCLFYSVSIIYASLISAFIIVSRYQYMMDVYATALVAAIVCTHDIVPKVALLCFVKKTKREGSSSENKPLVQLTRAEI